MRSTLVGCWFARAVDTRTITRRIELDAIDRCVALRVRLAQRRQLAERCSGAGERMPAQDPARAMVALIRHDLAGHLGHSWALLVREHQALVARAVNVRCPNGDPIDDAGVRTRSIRRRPGNPVLCGPRARAHGNEAVRWRMTVEDPEGPTGDAFANRPPRRAGDGRWRWTMSEASLASFRRRLSVGDLAAGNLATSSGVKAASGARSPPPPSPLSRWPPMPPRSDTASSASAAHRSLPITRPAFRT
jgi:hypothetical protein